LQYWQLFPAPEDFGNIPVWGFGEVIASTHPAIAVGERLFGYFPMATHLVIEAADVGKRGLRDAAAHRQDVASVYNAYARVVIETNHTINLLTALRLANTNAPAATNETKAAPAAQNPAASATNPTVS